MFDPPAAIAISILIVGSFALAILICVLHMDLRRRHRKAKAMISRLVEERDTARRALDMPLK